MLLDAHCHIDLFASPEKLVADIEAEGIFVLAMSNTPSMYVATVRNTRQAPHVLPCLGLHPSLGGRLKAELPGFLQLVRQANYIGEVGLDGTRERGEQAIQEDVFQSVLAAVDARRHLLSIHSRRRERVCLEALSKAAVRRAIFHWYSGPIALIDEITASGYYFSVNYAMCRSTPGRQRIAAMPPARILLESDGPFVKHGGAPVSPLLMTSLVSEVAHILGVAAEALNEQVGRNADSVAGPASVRGRQLE